MWNIVFVMFLLPQLILVSIYPIFSVRSYFNSLKRYEGIDGLGWIRREYPEDFAAISWLQKETSSMQQETCKREFLGLNLVPCLLSPVAIVEADGDSYTDYARFSAFTGRPTIIGWAVHEWLWRGTYDVVAPRREDVRQIYESEDVELTKALLNKYAVRYVIVGKLEREKYKHLQEWKFTQHQQIGAGFTELGREVFRSGGTVIYALDAKAHE